jgi:nicotinamide-nucleotide amidase
MVPGRSPQHRLRLGYSPAVSNPRRLVVAEILSVGSELTVGETRDTNSNELARSLTELGFAVGRIQAVPDELATVTDAFAHALRRADLVVSTGGLGPTPDDLTRESIAALAGETPAVDPGLEAWLRGMWARRGMPMPDLNLKQAWLIPSAVALPNPNGTAPGWWVDRPDGRVIVALPGPPREMRPIWHETVLPRLHERGVGATTARATLRLQGIGESVVADMIGEDLLRATNPSVATYARADAVDVRIAAVGTDAKRVVDDTTVRLRALLGDHVWATGDTTWADAIGAELEQRGWTLATVEVGSGGSFAAVLGDRPWLRLAAVLDPAAPTATAAANEPQDPEATDPDAEVSGSPNEPVERGTPSAALEALARRAMEAGGADVGVVLRASPRGGDTAVSVVVVRAGSRHRERRLVFLDGALGRSRAGLAAAAVLLADLRRAPASPVQTR